MTNLNIAVEKAPDAYELLGGRALTSRLVLDETAPECNPLGRRNRLVIAPGLLGGTGVPSSGRLSIGAKSPLTGGIKESNGGGTAAGKLARLGIKAIIVQGRPNNRAPYVVFVSRHRHELVACPELRLVGVYESAKRLQERFGSKVGIILIGPAGERFMTAAGVTNLDVDGVPSRYCARGGLGAVMGSQGLKAIVVDDSECGLRQPQRKPEFVAAVKELAQLIRTTPQTAEIYPKYGTSAMVRAANALGCLPTRNFASGRFDAADEISGERLHDLIVSRGGLTTHACMPGCLIRCSNVVLDREGGHLVSLLEYETIGLVGSNCQISSLDVIAEINRLCNDYGVDTLETGGAIGIAMQAGLLAFGDGEAAIRLVKEIGQASPIGKVIGQGAVLTARVLGVTEVPAVKGQMMPAYEPRGIKGMGVTYATSPMGADHTAGGTIRANVDHHDREGQIEASRNAQLSMGIYDALGLCMFVGSAVGRRVDLLASLVNSLYGIDWSVDGLTEYSRAILNAERAFNRRAGLTSAHDRLPEHFCEVQNPATQTVFDITDEELDWVVGN